MRKVIENGNRAVVIINQDGYVFACLWVNTRNGFDSASITHSRWEGKTVKGAEKWASKMLGL